MTTLSYALVLLSSIQAPGIDRQIMTSGQDLLRRAGCKVGAVSMLAEPWAAAITFEGTPPSAAAIAEAFRDREVDAVVVPQPLAPPHLLIADMDATIIAEESLDVLAEQMGVGEQVSRITARAMGGAMNFRQALLERLTLLEGTTVEALSELGSTATLNVGAEKLVRGFSALGAYTVLVTGGLRPVAEAVGERCGFDEVICNDVAFEGGLLKAEITGALVDAAGKHAALLSLAESRGGPGKALALGDGANDAPMLAAAGMSIAYRGKEPAKKAARVRFDHAPLHGALVLYGQGPD